MKKAISDHATENMTTDQIVNRLVEGLEDNGQWLGVGGVRQGGDAPATYTGGPHTYSSFQTAIRDRSDGRYLPFYETEYDLKRNRVSVRNLATYTSVAVGAIQALQVYTMGGDWEYEVVARLGEQVPDGLVREMQSILDQNLEKNGWVGGLDNEVHDRSREDGESLLAMYGNSDGLTDIRRLEPEMLTEPRNVDQLERWLGTDKRSNWKYGVHTVWDERMQVIDHTRHLGYHIIYEDSGQEYDYLPAWPQVGLGSQSGKCLHMIRRNVTRGAKRGVSDFWPILVDIEREDKLSENLSVGAAVQAAIAYIEKKSQGTTRQQATSDLTDAIDQFSSAVASSQSSQRSRRKLKAGTVLTTSHEYQAGPMGSLRSPIFIEVDQALLRRIGRRWLMPEYMISGDASNSNFASTLVAESPFVKAREADQRSYATEFKWVWWKAMKIAFDTPGSNLGAMGLSWKQVKESVDIQVKPQPVATRDKAALLSELTALFDREIISANEFRTDTGREEVSGLEGRVPSAVTEVDNTDSESGDSTRQAVIQSALESVTCREEAMAILEAL